MIKRALSLIINRLLWNLDIFQGFLGLIDDFININHLDVLDDFFLIIRFACSAACSAAWLLYWTIWKMFKLLILVFYSIPRQKLFISFRIRRNNSLFLIRLEFITALHFILERINCCSLCIFFFFCYFYLKRFDPRHQIYCYSFIFIFEAFCHAEICFWHWPSWIQNLFHLF